MQKRGQVKIVFTWIFILIVAISVLILGINLVRKFTNLSEKAIIENEIKKIENWIEQIYYLDKDSSKELQLNFPSSVGEVCFVHDKKNPTRMITSSFLHPDVIEFLQGEPTTGSSFNYNLFIIGEEFRFLEIKHITKENIDNICVNERGKIKLTNEGDYVKIEEKT